MGASERVRAVSVESQRERKRAILERLQTRRGAPVEISPEQPLPQAAVEMVTGGDPLQARERDQMLAPMGVGEREGNKLQSLFQEASNLQQAQGEGADFPTMIGGDDVPAMMNYLAEQYASAQAGAEPGVLTPEAAKLREAAEAINEYGTESMFWREHSPGLRAAIDQTFAAEGLNTRSPGELSTAEEAQANLAAGIHGVDDVLFAGLAQRAGGGQASLPQDEPSIAARRGLQERGLLPEDPALGEVVTGGRLGPRLAGMGLGLAASMRRPGAVGAGSGMLGKAGGFLGKAATYTPGAVTGRIGAAATKGLLGSGGAGTAGRIGATMAGGALSGSIDQGAREAVAAMDEPEKVDAAASANRIMLAGGMGALAGGVFHGLAETGARALHRYNMSRSPYAEANKAAHLAAQTGAGKPGTAPSVGDDIHATHNPFRSLTGVNIGAAADKAKAEATAGVVSREGTAVTNLNAQEGLARKTADRYLESADESVSSMLDRHKTLNSRFAQSDAGREMRPQRTRLDGMMGQLDKLEARGLDASGVADATEARLFWESTGVPNILAAKHQAIQAAQNGAGHARSLGTLLRAGMGTKPLREAMARQGISDQQGTLFFRDGQPIPEPHVFLPYVKRNAAQLHDDLTEYWAMKSAPNTDASRVGVKQKLYGWARQDYENMGEVAERIRTNIHNDLTAAEVELSTMGVSGKNPRVADAKDPVARRKQAEQISPNVQKLGLGSPDEAARVQALVDKGVATPEALSALYGLTAERSAGPGYSALSGSAHTIGRLLGGGTNAAQSLMMYPGGLVARHGAQGTLGQAARVPVGTGGEPSATPIEMFDAALKRALNPRGTSP